MRRRFFCFLLLCLVICGTIVTASAAGAEEYNAADVLYDLGLFSGTGAKADGSPNFDLDRAPTRHEAVTMLVSLLGKKEEALAGEWETPFTDVADWANPYVGYAYANGLTSGTSATTYGGNDLITASQYLTFVLKALGYETGTDFQWDKAWTFSDQLGLTDGRYNAANQTFLRGDVSLISRNALDETQKGSRQTLGEKLIAEKVFTKSAYKLSVESPLVIEEPDYEGWEYILYVDGTPVLQNVDVINLSIGQTYTFVAEHYGVVIPELLDTYNFEYNTWDSSGCSVKNNGDGSFTVTPKKNGTYIIYYEYPPDDPEDWPNGFYFRSNFNVQVGPYEKLPGLSLLRRGFVIEPDHGFGVTNVNHTIFVAQVLFDGEPISEYTVSCRDKSCTFTIQADGSLLIEKPHIDGEVKFTITYQGTTATFSVTTEYNENYKEDA